MDKETIKKDRLRYTNNKLSAKLTYLGILFNIAALGGVSFILYAGAYGL